MVISEKMCLGKEYGGMGFCSLHHFNIAMLGQQDWRIVSEPNFLLNKIFKAKYFSKGNFLSAIEGSNPSFI